MSQCWRSPPSLTDHGMVGCNADNLGVSSLHVTFNTEEESTGLTSVGFLQRTGIQYHW